MRRRRKRRRIGSCMVEGRTEEAKRHGREGREGIERVYSRQRAVGDVAAEPTAEVDKHRGLFLVLRPVESRRFARWLADEITEIVAGLRVPSQI